MRIRCWNSPAGSLGPAEIALRLTAVNLLLRPMGPWGVRPLLLMFAALAVIFAPILRASVTWYALTALVTLRIVADWPLPDNHIYLLAYWCLAIALALGARSGGRQLLRTSSTLLIGFAFLMAALWKGVLSPDYTDGRFFRVTLLTDDRFEDAALLFGGLTEDQLEKDRLYLSPLPEGAALIDPPDLIEPNAFKRLVQAATWGMLAAEALISAAFLISFQGRGMQVLRHALLLLFSIVTYAFAPVAGFGWLLLAMGLASCETDARLIRAAYVTVWFLVLFLVEIPWLALLARRLGAE